MVQACEGGDVANRGDEVMLPHGTFTQQAVLEMRLLSTYLLLRGRGCITRQQFQKLGQARPELWLLRPLGGHLEQPTLPHGVHPDAGDPTSSWSR